MKRDPLKASVLATKIIPNVSPDLAKEESGTGYEIISAHYC